MLNCTAPDCVLHIHHNHFTIQHHLQDNRQHHEHQQHTVMSGDSSQVSDSLIGNDTSSTGEIVHIDAPYDGWIMVCGFLIAMVLVAFIIVLVAFTISKLRKRDDSNLSPETPPNTNHNNNIIQPDVVVSANTAPVEPPPFLWLYSSKTNLAPPASTTTSSQYTLYNNDQDVLVHGSSCEDTRKCNGSAGGGGHGLKKNLGGKWKKLVKKKSPQEAYTIPAELKDQLKQIYVY